MTDENKHLKDVFRRYMIDELERPEIEETKKAFIKSHFSPSPRFVLRPALVVPAFSVLVIALAVTGLLRWGINAPVTIEEAVKSPNYQESPVILTEQKESFHPAQVKRLSSDTGSPMIFQKMYHDTTVTVVWVFQGSSTY